MTKTFLASLTALYQPVGIEEKNTDLFDVPPGNWQDPIWYIFGPKMGIKLR